MAHYALSKGVPYLSLWTYLLSVHIEGQFGQCWVNSVCVCVEGGRGGGGGGGGVPTPMSYVTVFKLYLGGEFFLCLLLYTSMLIKHIATFNIPV